MTERAWWETRRIAAAATFLLIAASYAHAGIFQKKAATQLKSPVVETVRVSTEGLLPDSLKPSDDAPQQTPVTPQPNVPTPEGAAAPVAAPDNYTLGPGDTLMFQSFDDPTLSREDMVVLYDGTVALPQVGDVKVAGKTRAEAEAMILEAYKKIFKEPLLALSVRATASKYFYVFGDVSNPSQYSYNAKINVLEAINIAGGLRITQRSGGESYAATTGTLTKAFLIRSPNGTREVIELDLRGLTKHGPHPTETAVLPGDVVYVPENVNLIYVLGEVRQPSVFQLSEGQNLLHVLTQAGGPNESAAKLRHIVIIRPVDPTHSDVIVVDVRQIFKTGVDIPMRPGDVVYVPRKDLVRAQEFVQRFTGTISPILSLYTQMFDAYYADERNRLLVDTGDDGNGLLGTLQTIRSFIGSGGNNSSLLSTLSILSAQQNQQP